MSTENQPAASGPSLAGSSRSRQAESAPRGAHEPDGLTGNQTDVFVTANAVVVATPDHTRVENPRRGTTDYGQRLPRQTRRALAEVANAQPR